MFLRASSSTRRTFLPFSCCVTSSLILQLCACRAPRMSPRRHCPAFACPDPMRCVVVSTPCAWWLERYAQIQLPICRDCCAERHASRCPDLLPPPVGEKNYPPRRPSAVRAEINDV